ncbi:cytochrome P450 [Crassisporium funariophilum]|nr:cytochrome P450 [Crassisporium funariophilum]
MDSIIPPLSALQSAVWANSVLSITCGIIVYWVGLSYYRGQTRQLKHIPSAGSNFPVISYLGTLGYLLDARKVINGGIKKWHGGVFKIPDLFKWVVVLTDPKQIEDLRKAPESVLSAFEAIDELLQTEYTLGVNISQNPYHIPIIRAQLTRALPRLVPEVREEIVDAFNDFIPVTEEWTSVLALETMMKIVCRASNRIFVGLPLCKDPDFVDLNVKFTVDVVTSGAILRMVPRFLRPFVNSLVSAVPKRTKHGLKHLAPIIQARRQERLEKGDDFEGSVDLLTWLMDEAKDEEVTDLNLTSRILTVNFAAIHTSSMTFVHAFYYLAAFPEYMQPLRDEVEEVIKREGWTKEGLDKMHKLDSFIKESQRLHPLGSLMMTRVAQKDYTFSDGTSVPRGTTVAVSIHNAHLDPESFEDPLTFDGFRFAKMKERDSETKVEIVSTGTDSLAFGHGRHACPGRYFAACELKLMLAHAVLTYDVKLETEGVRPLDMWVVTACVPDPKASVMFRKRVL